jgi:eukaryotic-like serine/threonine-protein kinase
MQKVGLSGYSSGATHGVRLIAVEPRVRAAVFTAAGFFPRQAQSPETDTWNFAPRVRIPVLMLGGRYDHLVSYETNQRVVFKMLGSKEKVIKQYDGGHAGQGARPDLIGASLDWFDKYLGPVDHRP